MFLRFADVQRVVKLKLQFNLNCQPRRVHPEHPQTNQPTNQPAERPLGWVDFHFAAAAAAAAAANQAGGVFSVLSNAFSTFPHGPISFQPWCKSSALYTRPSNMHAMPLAAPSSYSAEKWWTKKNLAVIPISCVRDAGGVCCPSERGFCTINRQVHVLGVFTFNQS